MNSDDPRILAILKRSDTCVDGGRWLTGSRAAGHLSAQAVWDNCPRGDWLIWAAAVSGTPKPQLVQAALTCIKVLVCKQPEVLQPPDLAIARAVERRESVPEALLRRGQEEQSIASLAVYQLARLALADSKPAILAMRAAASVCYAALAMAGSSGSESEQHQRCAEIVRECIQLPTGGAP